MDFFKSSEIENKDTGSGKNVFSNAFVDKMNDDFKEAQEVCEASNEIVDSLHDLPEKDLADEFQFSFLPVAFPVTNRVIFNRGYAGISGGLTLAEDILGILVSGR